jgi:hypothetical protein
MRRFNRGADAADEAAALSHGTQAQRRELQKLSSPKRAVSLQLLSSRRLQRSWVFDIFCQKMNGNDSREFKKRRQLVISPHNEALSVIAVRVSNQKRFRFLNAE